MKFRHILPIYIAFTILVNLSIAQSTTTLDSLHLKLNNSEHDTARVKILIKMIEETQSSPDSLILFYNNANEIIKRNVLKEKGVLNKIFLVYKGDLLNGIGTAFFNSDNNKALTYFKQSLKIRLLLDDKKGSAECYNNMGACYHAQNDFNNAFNYLNKAIKINEAISNKKGLAFSFYYIGIIYTDQGYADKAMEYFNKSLLLRKDLKDKKDIAELFYMIAENYKNQNNTSEALTYLFKALEISRETGNTYIIATDLNNIGVIYRTQNNFTTALDFFNESLTLYNQIKNPIGIGSVYHNIGVTYSKQKNYTKAIEYCRKGLKNHIDIGYTQGVKNACDQLSFLYKQTRDFEKSLMYYEQYIIMRDSINNEENQKSIIKNQLQHRYEKEKLLLKQEQIKKEFALKLSNKAVLQRKNYWVYGSLSIVIILLLMGLFSYRNYKQKQKNALQENIILEQKMLRSQMNPHFIFNSLGVIHEYIKKNKSELAGKYLVRFSNLMRLILENSREESIPLEKEIEMLNNYLSLYQLILYDGFHYKINISENINPETLCIPPMLVQPFVENALKHGIANKENGELIINFRLKNEMIIFEVIDNGIGYSESKKTKHQQEKQHESLAIQIVYERLKNIDKGKKVKISICDIVNDVQKIIGTKVEIEIPTLYFT